MKVGILSADEPTKSFLEKTIHEYSSRRYHSMKIVMFSRLRDYLGCQDEFDCIIIDDNFERRPSVETARLIRTKDSNVSLILIANTPEKVYDSFTVNAHRFILRPVTQSAIFEAFDARRKEYNSYKLIIAKTPEGFQAFSSEETLYVLANGKQCILVTKTKRYNLESSFAQILSQLPKEYFFVTHRSHVVNMKHIQKFDAVSVLMADNQVLSISKRRKVDFFVAYNAFVKGHSFN